MTKYENVCVFCEQTDAGLLSISMEALGIGRKLADDLNQSLIAVIIGSKVADLAASAIHYGADKVYVCDSPLLNVYQTDLYVVVMQKLIDEVGAQIIIMGQTDVGRDLAPRLAFRYGTIATLDCLDLAIDSSKRLLRTKPVYGGNARQMVSTDIDPQIATVRNHAMVALEPDKSRQGEIIPFDPDVDISVVRSKLLEKVVEEVQGIKLEDASIVISGGRGIGGPEAIAELEKFAKLLKAGIGASRPVTDSNWVPTSMLVGLTGKIIAPDVYIAVAISGSMQHMAGCSGSKTIIAINRDPDANIFNFAQYGVVEDWKKFLPAFSEKVKTMIA